MSGEVQGVTSSTGAQISKNIQGANSSPSKLSFIDTIKNLIHLQPALKYDGLTPPTPKPPTPLQPALKYDGPTPPTPKPPIPLPLYGVPVPPPTPKPPKPLPLYGVPFPPHPAGK